MTTPDTPDQVDALDELLREIERDYIVESPILLTNQQIRDKAKAKLSALLVEARIDEREVAIAQLDGVYQACVRDQVLTPDGLNGYHCAIEDACKDRDDRIKELEKQREVTT